MYPIGETIAALRKERGITQEQLGQLVGVSAQAVSKWEKGGMPDAELLPAIADRLGVTIDTLFGRGREKQEDIKITVNHWLRSMPESQRMDAFFRMLAANFCSFSLSLQTFGLPDWLDFLPTKASMIPDPTTPGGHTVWVRSRIVSDEGLLLGVLAEDMPLFMLLPEPPDGYEAHFASDEEYRQLFAALLVPGSMEILRTLHRRKRGRLSTGAIAKSAGLPPEEAQKALQALLDCRLLVRTEIELEEGTVDTYTLTDNSGLIPFLYMARWLMDDTDGWTCCWDVRKRPPLSLPKKKEESL